MSLTLRQKLLLASIVACALLSSVRSLDSAPTESRETLAEFLASRPLVVVGRVVRVTGQDDRPIGVGCGVTGLISLRVTDMQLRVEEVLEGVAEDTLLDVAVVGHDLAKQFDPGLFGPGARVLFWGDRFCEMPWRTSGGIVVVRNDDSLLPTRSDWASESFHPNGWQSLEYLYALRLDLETFRDRSGTSSYRGAGAIALAVVKEVDFDGASVSYVCDSLGWVLGKSARMPRELRWNTRVHNRCSAHIQPGDTLLVPVRPGHTGGTITIDSCLRGLEVQHSFVPELGVYLAELERAFVMGPNGLSLAPILARRREQ